MPGTTIKRINGSATRCKIIMRKCNRQPESQKQVRGSTLLLHHTQPGQLAAVSLTVVSSTFQWKRKGNCICCRLGWGLPFPSFFSTFRTSNAQLLAAHYQSSNFFRSFSIIKRPMPAVLFPLSAAVEMHLRTLCELVKGRVSSVDPWFVVVMELG